MKSGALFLHFIIFICFEGILSAKKIYFDINCRLYNSCLNGGTCIDQPKVFAFYTCACRIDFTGKNCESPIITSTKEKIMADEYCDLYRPCRNEGTCVNGNYSDRDNLFYCLCQQGFNGKKCESYILYASATIRTTTKHSYETHCTIHRPCLNGGRKCLVKSKLSSFYYCSCGVDFTGNNCQNRLRLTTTSTKHQIIADEYCDLYRPCRNGGTCVNGNYSDRDNLFYCLCQQGFNGKKCENII